MQNFCMNCGTKLKAECKFCHHCGTPLKQGEEVDSSAIQSVSVRDQYLPLVVNELRSAGPIPDYYKVSLLLNKIKETDNSPQIEALQQIAYLYSKIDELHHKLGFPVHSSVFSDYKELNSESDQTEVKPDQKSNSNWSKYAGLAAASFAGTFFANQVYANSGSDSYPYTDWELLSEHANYSMNNYDFNNLFAGSDYDFLRSLYGLNNTSEFRNMVENGGLGDLAGDGNPLGIDTPIDSIDTTSLSDTVNITDASDVVNIDSLSDVASTTDVSDVVDTDSLSDAVDSIIDFFS